MLALTQMPARRPPPEVFADRTRPDGPSTQITSAGASAGASPRLVVTAGPRKGAEFVLAESPATVGRGSGNGVALADLSVSRRHSCLERQGARWVVRDQGSGNGTRVNGRWVERQPLRHGDEIALGDTRLRFLEPEGVIAWGDVRGAGWRGRAHLYAASIVAVGIVLGAGVVRQRRFRESVEAQQRAQELREAARSHLERSVALRAQGRRAEARDHLAVAAELDPGNPEVSAAARLAEAGTALGAATAEPPASVAPREAAPAPASPKPGGAQAAARSAVEAYLDGDVGVALRRARGVQGRGGAQLVALLERFAGSLRAGQSEADPAAALRALEDAAAADAAIARGRDGRPGREVRKALAARHLGLARALAAEDALPQRAAHLRAALRSDPANGEARAELSRAAGRARDLYLRAYLAKEGDDLAAARRGFGLVAQALPGGDETGDKARRWLAKLDGKAER